MSTQTRFEEDRGNSEMVYYLILLIHIGVEFHLSQEILGSCNYT